MTAPSLNVNFAAPAAAAPGHAANAPGKAGDAAVGAFESVLAGLFGQARGLDTAAAGAKPIKAVQDASLDVATSAVANGEVADAKAISADATDTDTVATDDTTSSADAATPVVPGVITDTTVDPAQVGIPVATTAPVTEPVVNLTPPAKGESAAAPAYGRDKAKGVPAAPALEHANPNARLVEKAGAADDEAPPLVEAKSHPLPPPQSQRPEKTPPTLQQTSASPAEPAGTSDTKTGLKAEAPVGDLVPAATAGEAPAAEAQAAAPTIALASRGAVPAPRGAGKSERARDAIDAAGSPREAPASRRVTDNAPDAPVAAAPSVDKEAVETAARAPQDQDAPDNATTQPQAPAQTGAATASAHAAHTPVRGAPETVASLAAQIVKKLEARSTRFDLELNPAGLGKVDVRLEIGAAGQISAAMTFDNPGAAAELKARANELQRALEQAGFNLSGGLTFDVAGDRGQGGRAWDQANDQSGQGFRGRAYQDALSTASDAVEQAVSGALRLRRGLSSALDVRI